MNSSFKRGRARRGTSLVEILVVMVVFLVGILAIVQIFPGGFKNLRYTQNNSIATALARAEIEMLKNHADQLPDGIVPVQYAFNGTNVTISTLPDRFPNDLGPAFATLDATGQGLDGSGNPLGNWQYLIGPNIGRRVLGEGRVIPAPRHVGNYYGSLLTLQFAPVVFNPAYNGIFTVYGNNMTKRDGDPLAEGFRVRNTEFWVAEADSSTATITFPVNPAKTVTYVIDLTMYQDPSQATNSDYRKDIVGYQVPIAPGDSGKVSLSSLFPGFKGADFDSIRCARAFEDVTSYAPGVWGLDQNDPYTFKLISPERGLVLFNPVGYNYMVRMSGGRRAPLMGRVSYDVYDWRIIHEEFQAPSESPYQFRLAINSVKVHGLGGPDGKPNAGIGVQAPDMTGALHPADLILEDTKTGALLAYVEDTADPSKTTYTVNKSTGLVTLIDQDPGTPGTQVMTWLPGQNLSQVVTVDNRSIRALYMGRNEWAVQVMKPAAVMNEAWARPGANQFYVGQSVQGDGTNGARVYFPPAAAGRIVSLGEVYYYNTSGAEVGPVPLTAQVSADGMDSVAPIGGCPYVDVSKYISDFAGFDYNYGAAVKSVKGASVAVRVLWNPDFFQLATSTDKNMDSLRTWMQSWRRTTVETYLQRGN